MPARAARAADLKRVQELLAAAGAPVETASLERRLESDDGGVLVCETATISWAMDGRALHIYDIAGGGTGIATLLDELTAIAQRELAVVLCATLYAGDPSGPLLQAHGFERDWEEPDVRGGEVRALIGYLRPTE